MVMGKKVAVIHPDLGIGGAERLIVDASKALQESGHEVKIYTGYHDKTRCFEETSDGSLKVFPIGSWIPRSIFGKCHALMAYLKMIYISLSLLIISKHDLILCDQISASIPILKYLDFRNRNCKIVFYCHFPDQLLTTRESFAKRLYRRPLDFFEEWSTSLADVIVVNSEFTSSIVKRTFKRLKNRKLVVLYPCVNVNNFTSYKGTEQYSKDEHDDVLSNFHKHQYIFLSLNRFERKKNLALAILALNDCLSDFQAANKGHPLPAHLIIAGGYDERLKDCVQYFDELESLVNNLNLASNVTFIKSPNDNVKLQLLQLSHAIVYTPDNEHFGIVPLEAMAMSKPVIASASGGPLETIENGLNGLLCEPSEKYSFADAMLRLASDKELSERMGKAGLERVKSLFSYEKFRTSLNEICFGQELHSGSKT